MIYHGKDDQGKSIHERSTARTLKERRMPAASKSMLCEPAPVALSE
jgi:hypothetical protein